MAQKRLPKDTILVSSEKNVGVLGVRTFLSPIPFKTTQWDGSHPQKSTWLVTCERLSLAIWWALPRNPSLSQPGLHSLLLDQWTDFWWLPHKAQDPPLGERFTVWGSFGFKIHWTSEEESRHALSLFVSVFLPLPKICCCNSMAIHSVDWHEARARKTSHWPDGLENYTRNMRKYPWWTSEKPSN